MGGLQTGYPGLEYLSDKISDYIPECKYFAEPFAGLGRISKKVKADYYALNDKSNFAYAYLKENFKSPFIYNLDFEEFYYKFNFESTIMFFDPPWSRTDYEKNNRTFCDRGVGEYYTKIFKLLTCAKCHWIVAGRALGGARSTLSKYARSNYNIILWNNKKSINGHTPKVLLVSNKPFVRQSTLRGNDNE